MGYFSQLADLISNQPKLFGDFAAILPTTLIPNKAIAAQNILAAQNALRTNGFSPELMQLFLELNIDSATQQLTLQDLLALDPNQIDDLADNFPNSLRDPSFIASLENTSLALKQGVIGAQTSTAVPEPFTVIGTLLGGAAAFGMKKRFKATNKL